MVIVVMRPRLPETRVQATGKSGTRGKANGGRVETVSTAVQGRILDGVDFGAQAFEHDPLEGLLSRKEVCSLIRIDDLVGLGIKENPEATFDGHSVSSKRLVDKGIVYQVIILKELYTQEKETVKVIEVPKKNEKKNVAQGKEQEVVEVIDLESEVQETTKANGSKAVVKIKEEKKEEKDVKVEEELRMFKEKPWAKLRQKIIGKQVRQSPVPVPDMRTPYQIRTESPQEPDLCLLEINSHIRRAMEEIDEFLKGKSMTTSSFLPLSLSRKITEQYSSYLKPSFDLDPELATQLEGLLAGVAFSGLNKRSVAVSSGELEKLAQTSFNMLEIVSFLMASIAIMDEGLAGVADRIKGTTLSMLTEYRPFLGSMDKACRHLVRESLAQMATFMIKQRIILGSCFAATAPKSYRTRVIKAPLASFEVAPKEVLEAVKAQFDVFIQQKAFTSAVARLGAVNKFRGTSRTVKRKVMVVTRGNRARGLGARGIGNSRGSRGLNRGALRGVRRPSGMSRNMRGYARRDRALAEPVQQASSNAGTSVTGFSNGNQL